MHEGQLVMNGCALTIGWNGSGRIHLKWCACDDWFEDERSVIEGSKGFREGFEVDLALISLLLREDLFVSLPYYREKACSEVHFQEMLKQFLDDI
ncbi:hypothetical protein CsSME_00044241 [Camellia sinensis var. sinensis]